MGGEGAEGVEGEISCAGLLEEGFGGGGVFDVVVEEV